ncbi:unnamed protein product [Cochlearia groenlandica]
MMKTKQQMTKVVFLFISVVMALVCHHQTKAQEPNPSLEDCYSPIMKVKGCLDGVKFATKGDLSGLGKDCCHAINGLSDDCLSIIFPGKPYIVFMVKALCKTKFNNVNY